MAGHQNSGDQDAHKGAVEGDDRTNTSMAGQNPHRTDNPAVKANDTDFPEPGNNPEHSGERQDTGMARRGSTLSHEQRGARNRNSNTPGLKRAAADRDREENPAEGADIQANRSPERERVDQDPGHKQKRMHNDEKDDPLAA